MKKVAAMMVLAVFVPSLALAWLAFRSVQAQELAMERQRSLLYREVASSVVKDIIEAVLGREHEFAQRTESLLAQHRAGDLAHNFDTQLCADWPMAEVGFVVSAKGGMLSPSLLSRPEARRFRLENERFLTSRESAEVYWQGPKGQVNLSALDDKQAGLDDWPKGKGGFPSVAAQAEFRQLVGDASQGSLARFLQDRLKLFVWYRPPAHPDLIFGAQLSLPLLIEEMRHRMVVENDLEGEILLALLNENSEAVAVYPPAMTAEWKSPFEAVEIGDALPHWKVAVYLADPQEIYRAASSLGTILSLIIVMLVLVIALGGWLVARELRGELRLARQRTDFVSQVSHELKTPLTSIRMFSEMLAEGRVREAEKQRFYLGVISAESSRLTRLIDNVLDFSRLERGQKQYRLEWCDLRQVVEEALDHYRPQLEKNGFKLECCLPPAPVWVRADPDAVAQVMLNLLSNAEKYSGSAREIRIEILLPETPDARARVRVLDRGLGVAKGCEEKIFDHFFRVNDLLSNRVQGTGLGLTLARQIARAHGGDVSYAPRPGGGSIFTLELMSHEEAHSDH